MLKDWLPCAESTASLCSAAQNVFQGLDWYAILIAVVTPILLVYARHEILIRRLRTILDFMQSFKLYGPAEGGRYNPSFEFVKSKYISDIKIRSEDQTKLDKIESESKSDNQEEAKLKFYINLATKAGSRSSKQLYISSIGFMLVTYYGMSSLIKAFECNFRAVSSCAQPFTISDQMLVIGSLAFAGAFVGSLRMLLRCLAVYDLSAFSMLRHTAEIIFTVIFVMLIFRAFPDPLFNVGKLLLPDTVITNIENAKRATPEDQPRPGETDTAQAQAQPQTQVQPTLMADTAAGIPWLWFALAPALGLLPASATRFMLMKMQSLISWMKTTDDRFSSVSQVTSLDIIDGIDFETRFRLEECGIYDVQNLATYNPVMLHIETPYGIYQAIDWIAQAQLCHIVGQEKFLMFREVNIRTIFDLERAIDSINSPHAFDNIYASILFAPTDNLKKAAAISQFRFLITDNKNLTRQVSVEEFCTWAREQLRAPIDDKAEAAVVAANEERFASAVEHLMVWISDDLHIRRLRRLWIDISSSLGADAEHFPDSKRIPRKAELLRKAEDKLASDAAKDREGENQQLFPAKGADSDADHDPDNQDQGVVGDLPAPDKAGGADGESRLEGEIPKAPADVSSNPTSISNTQAPVSESKNPDEEEKDPGSR